MSLIKFDLSVSPDKPKLTFDLELTATKAKLSLEPLDLSISAKPSTGTIVGGAIAGAILGGFVGGGLTVGVVYGVAKAIGDTLSSKVKDTVAGFFPYEIDFGAPLGFSFDVEGIQVHVQAETLKLSTFNGMLMGEATVKVS